MEWTLMSESHPVGDCKVLVTLASGKVVPARWIESQEFDDEEFKKDPAIAWMEFPLPYPHSEAIYAANIYDNGKLYERKLFSTRKSRWDWISNVINEDKYDVPYSSYTWQEFISGDTGYWIIAKCDYEPRALMLEFEILSEREWLNGV